MDGGLCNPHLTSVILTRCAASAAAEDAMIIL